MSPEALFIQITIVHWCIMPTDTFCRTTHFVRQYFLSRYVLSASMFCRWNVLSHICFWIFPILFVSMRIFKIILGFPKDFQSSSRRHTKRLTILFFLDGGECRPVRSSSCPLVRWPIRICIIAHWPNRKCFTLSAIHIPCFLPIGWTCCSIHFPMAAGEVLT